MALKTVSGLGVQLYGGPHDGAVAHPVTNFCMCVTVPDDRHGPCEYWLDTTTGRYVYFPIQENDE